MKLVSTKLPKRKDDLASKPAKMDGPRYPYGMKLTFEDEMAERIDGLSDLNVGDKVEIEGIGEVVEVSSHEYEAGKKTLRVEVQLHEVGCEYGDDEGEHESMGDAMRRAEKKI